MFWLAFRSGYASARANRRPSAPPSCASAPWSCGHRGGIRRVRRRRLQPCHRGVARLDDRFERLALVLHVALRRLDQIRNEVVAAGELHIDLRESVLERVARRDEPVVHPDHEKQGENDQDQNHDQGQHGTSAHTCAAHPDCIGPTSVRLSAVSQWGKRRPGARDCRTQH